MCTAPWTRHGFPSVNKCRGGQSSDDINSYWIKITAWHWQVDTKWSRRVSDLVRIYIYMYMYMYTSWRRVDARSCTYKAGSITRYKRSAIGHRLARRQWRNLRGMRRTSLLSMHRSVVQQDYYDVCRLECCCWDKGNVRGLTNVVCLILLQTPSLSLSLSLFLSLFLSIIHLIYLFIRQSIYT